MKKNKGVEVTLFNFNEQDNEQKKKTNKSKKVTSKNNVKKKQKNNTKEKSQSNNRFDFDNEFVIGLTKVEDKVSNNKSKKNTKSKKTSNKSKQTQSKKNTNKKGINKNTNIKNSNKKNQTKNKDVKDKKTTKKLNKNLKIVNENIKEKNIHEEDIIKKKRNFKTLKYISLISCVFIAIIATMLSPLFNIKQIKVEGNIKLTDDEVISLSKIELEQNTYKISKSKTRQRILKEPYVKSVQVKRKLPSTVEIIIEEKKATFMIEYGGGYAYISNQGYILEISSEKIDVPILQGAETNVDDLVPGNRLCVDDLEKMSTVLKIIEVAANNDIAKLISRIDMENKQNYKIVFESEKKVAYIGDETDLSTKILNIKAILEKEKDIPGEIFVNMNLRTNDATFRQSV